jgi:subtilisin family serine protease/ligand-binding sensor domain-containing protein
MGSLIWGPKQVVLIAPIYCFLLLLTACNGGGGASGTASNATSDQETTDPLYEYSWHLENTGQKTFSLTSGAPGVDAKIKPVITSGIDGLGVNIGISDSGIEYSHEDLAGNYIQGISKNFYNPYPYPGNPSVYQAEPAMHGTAVTGIISAVGWNGKGSRGVAPKSKFGGFNYLAKGVVQSIDKTLIQMQGEFDIFNYSYGGTPCTYSPMGSNTTEKNAILDAFETSAASQRDGKGAIYVKSAGNEFTIETAAPVDKGGCGETSSWLPQILGNSTLLESNNYPYTIIVGAIDSKGYSTTYSSPGSNLWISAPGGEDGLNFDPTQYGVSVAKAGPAIIAPDISGCINGSSTSDSIYNSFENNENGLNPNCNYTSTMNGTSSAAPVTTGVIALMLQENPNLSWRDVKHILASTAYVVDTNTGEISHPGGRNLTGHAYMNGWKRNNAGYSFHNWYGFGIIHAENAVNMAKNYDVNLGEFKQTTNTNNGNWIYDSGTLNKLIPNNSASGVTDSLNIKHNYIIESLQVKVSVTHGYAENIGIEITSPAGTTSKVILINSGVLDYNYNDALFTTNAFYGEESRGNWTIKIVDGADLNPDGTRGTSGTLTNWKINILGHKIFNPDDQTVPEPITNLQLSSYYNSSTSTPFVSFSNSTSSDVLRYEYCVGTATNNCSISDWLILNGTQPFQLTGLNLNESGTYFFNVRTVDVYENESNIISSSWVVDTAVPTSVSNINNSAYYNSLTASPQISFTASSSIDISKYEYSIGTTNGSINIKGWTSINLSSSFQVTGLALANGTKYFVNIRAVDNAGNTSAISTSFWTVDAIAPSAPTGIVLYSPTSSYGKEDKPIFEIAGVSSGEKVRLYSNSSCTSIIGEKIINSLPARVETYTLVNGSYAVYAKRIDLAENESPCTTNFASYTKIGSFITLPQGASSYNQLSSNWVNAIVIDGSKLYVGTNAGLSISNNAGATFSTKTTLSGLGSNEIQGVAARNNYIYAGTNSGLSISVDGGNTFSTKKLLTGTIYQQISKVVLDDLGNLYCLSNGGDVGSINNIYKSTNNGVSFSVVLSSPGSSSIIDFTVGRDGKLYALRSDKKVLTSINSGQNFTTISDVNLNSFNSPQKISVDSTGIIYISTNYSGLLISYDHGINYINKTVSNGLISNNLRDVYVDNSDILYAGSTNGLSVSNNYGNNFTNNYTSNGMWGTNVVGVTTTDSNGTIYAGTSGGLLISSNNGTNFSSFFSNNSLKRNIINDIFVASDGKIYLTSYDSGLFISGDGGLTFTNKTRENANLAQNLVYSVLEHNGTIYVGTFSGLSISTNGGNSFTNRTIAHGLGADYIFDIAVDSHGVIYVGTTGGLSISHDSGSTFVNKTTVNGLPLNAIRSIHIDNNDNIFIATDGGLSISTDGGSTFNNKTIASGLSSNSIFKIETSFDGTKIYVATSQGVDISNNGGSTFTSLSVPMTSNRNAYDIALDGNKLYVATGENGVLYSSNGGSTFLELNTSFGVPNKKVDKLFTKNNRLYIGTTAGFAAQE